MGYVQEPNGVTLTVEKQKLSKETVARIKEYIAESKQRNAKQISELKKQVG